MKNIAELIKKFRPDPAETMKGRVFLFLFLTSLLTLAGNAGATAVSVVQSVGGTSPKTTFNSPNTAGNTIIAVIQWLASSGSVSISSVNDSKGNTYTLIPGSLANAGPTPHYGNIYTEIAYAANINGGSNTVTVTTNTGAGAAVSLLEVTPGIFDQASIANGSSGHPNAGSLTPIANGAFAVATAFVDDGFGGGPQCVFRWCCFRLQHISKRRRRRVG